LEQFNKDKEVEAVRVQKVIKKLEDSNAVQLDEMKRELEKAVGLNKEFENKVTSTESLLTEMTSKLKSAEKEILVQ